MAVRIAVGNRQGGVGKTTVAMMLTRYLSDVAKKRVLCLDLDTQCNFTSALIGPELTVERFDGGQTLADALVERFENKTAPISQYIFRSAGDGCTDSSIGGLVDLVCSSVDLDEVIHDAMKETQVRNLFGAFNPVMGGFLRVLEENYDYVLMDCPPGISPLVFSALALADFIVVPHRPDRV